MAIDSLSFGDLRIEGVSRAGEETWIRVHPPGLVFDVGRGATRLAGAADVFLTHGHLDHALGLPYVLSLRTLYNSQATRVFAPAAIGDGLEQLIGAAETLEGVEYDYEIQRLEPGDRIPVARDLSVEAFATDHILPSLGFHLRRAKKRLKSEYQGCSSRELADLKARGTDVEIGESKVWLSYCGDTGPEVFDLEPRILESSVLLIECTFFDEVSRDRARRFGHMHLDDLVERASEFENQHLVLHHTSRRHSCEQLRTLVAERLDLEGPEVHLFGCIQSDSP